MKASSQALFALFLLASVASAQQAAGTKAVATPFTEAAAKAKESGRPLIVFGVSDTCERCQALKKGLASEPEIKDLLSNYVAAEVPFGGREFAAIFQEIVRQDKSLSKAIGAPSVFIFTAKGAVVYAGPNRESGMAADAEFVKLLQTGIEKNGPARAKAAAKSKAGSKSAPAGEKPVTPAVDPGEKPALPAARVWKSKSGKFSVTASLVSFDGVTANLKSSEGKAIAVPLEALSLEDQRFLRDMKAKE